eukprot:SAG25_NODE_5247_length_683_cov_0.905822_1_plen_44_part_10
MASAMLTLQLHELQIVTVCGAAQWSLMRVMCVGGDNLTCVDCLG